MAMRPKYSASFLRGTVRTAALGVVAVITVSLSELQDLPLGNLERNGSTKSGDYDCADTGEALTDVLTRQVSHQEQVRYFTKVTIGADDRDRLDLTFSGKPLPPFGGGRIHRCLLLARRITRKKLKIMAILGFATMGVAWGSSIFATVTREVSEKFHVGLLVACGFASGPLCWAPMSELYGRRLPIIVYVIRFSVFNLAVARAYDIQTIMICRFFGSFFGASCLAVVPATFNDIFTNEWRGTALVCFSGATYVPVVLVKRAANLRRRTGNWGIHARLEQTELDFKGLIERNFSRPAKMLFTEPIMFLVSIYPAFIYRMLYLLLEAYPIIIVEGYHMSASVGELPYIANNNRPVPEMRLLPTIIGGIVFPIGMFWLKWSGAYPEHVHWIVSTLAGLFIGSGIILIFLTLLTYLIESYMIFAASAMAANTFLRSGFAAGFPLFARANNLGVQWAGTLLGCIGILLVPVPVLFYLSKYAPDM
ncbi:major facilitator superfamily domain-containing protein [Lipomyces tetrasporus]|uniref:Major facilitator superfamily domain-containing protein n=1 Tax=Lipomyces tetrasporus TaxID=54092 RepID=A0AAD7QMP0_9ASCO|nr:major facilitator superfamily domain-containing protein [Lipomyces tetrasporus]KAJ8097716.1 major facilitator superfamily domain-containing protein [Lipomyces tetrasporus]